MAEQIKANVVEETVELEEVTVREPGKLKKFWTKHKGKILAGGIGVAAGVLLCALKSRADEDECDDQEEDDYWEFERLEEYSGDTDDESDDESDEDSEEE